MILKQGQISIRTSEKEVTIILNDGDSSQEFAIVTMTPEQFTQALGRLSNTECQIEVEHLERVGKVMEHKTLEFEIPFDPWKYIDEKETNQICCREAKKACPEGWISDNYFGSRNSFFEKDGKQYARTTIRRWV